MKCKNWPFKIFRQIFVIVVLSVLISSCSKKLQFTQSAVVPAAKGRVKIKKDDNGNYAIDLEISNLAKSEQLQPPKQHYIVWLESDQTSLKNLGQLKSSSGLFSSTLKASLNTVTSFKPKRIFITAEDAVDLTYPQGPPVLTTTNY